MKSIKNIAVLLLVCSMLLALGSCGKGENTVTSTDGTTQSGVVNVIPTQGYTEAVAEIPVTESVSEVQNVTQGVAAPTTTSIQVPQTTAASQPVTAQQSQTEVTYGELQLISSPVTYESGSVTQIVYLPIDFCNNTQKYPLIAWANGTGCPPDLYAGLLQKLADGGYIVIANSETMAADGTAQIGSIDFMLNENNNSESLFYNRVNSEKIGVAGHSQGGRSSVNAAAADSRIDCVLSVAGSNFVEEAEKLSTPTFFMAGTNDMVVSSDRWIVTAYNACKGPAVYASLNGAIHTTCCTEPEAYSDYGVMWFDAWLKNDAQAKQSFRNGGKLSSDGAWTEFACKGF